MKKTNFDQLLERYLTGHITDAEKTKLEVWLDVMKVEDTKDLELNKEDEEKLYEKIISKKDNINEIKTFLPFKDEEKKISRAGWIFRVAASLVVIALVGYTINRFNGSKNPLTFTSDKGIEKIILNDGTLVWLQKGSKLIYLDNGQSNRYAELEGEALFEVAKDPSHPFLIKFNGAVVKVLGTSFSLSTNGKEVLVKVLTGKVNITNLSNTVGVDIEPNQKATLKPSGQVDKESMQPSEIEDITKGTEYVMNFSDTSLNDVLKSLSKKFDVSFNLLNQDAGNCRITADLTDQSLERSKETIQEILNVRFDLKGTTVNVEGAGCK